MTTIEDAHQRNAAPKQGAMKSFPGGRKQTYCRPSCPKLHHETKYFCGTGIQPYLFRRPNHPRYPMNILPVDRGLSTREIDVSLSQRGPLPSWSVVLSVAEPSWPSRPSASSATLVSA